LLITAWLNYLDEQNILPLFLFSCAIHELGHLAALACMGKGVDRICLSASGAEISISHPLGYAEEGIAALMGPGVNFAMAVIQPDSPQGRIMAGINLALGCFNLLPIYGLDGSRALFCAAAAFFSPEKAGAVLDTLGKGLLLAMVLGGGHSLLQGGNGTLFLVSIFLIGLFRAHCRIKGERMDKI